MKNKEVVEEYLTNKIYDPRKSEKRKKNLMNFNSSLNNCNFDAIRRKKEMKIKNGINKLFNQILNK